jgi:hypothetical protein
MRSFIENTRDTMATLIVVASKKEVDNSRKGEVGEEQSYLYGPARPFPPTTSFSVEMSSMENLMRQ